MGQNDVAEALELIAHMLTLLAEREKPDSDDIAPRSRSGEADQKFRLDEIVEATMFDWFCFKLVMWLPIHKFNVDGAFIQFVLPRAGRYAHR